LCADSAHAGIPRTPPYPLAAESPVDGVGLPSRAPPISPSRLDRQLEFDEAA
jgi:hypothetical protein